MSSAITKPFGRSLKISSIFGWIISPAGTTLNDNLVVSTFAKLTCKSDKARRFEFKVMIPFRHYGKLLHHPTISFTPNGASIWCSCDLLVIF